MRHYNTTKWLLALTAAALGSVCQGGDWTIPENAPLLTRWAKEVNPTKALSEYQRPQLVRDASQNYGRPIVRFFMTSW
jgi:hypothetical protein